jgi:predicted nuclease of restriction endonuclease-like RecB superfamily
MLPSDLLLHRNQGTTIVPRRLAMDGKSLAMATELIALVQSMVGQRQGDLDRQLQELEGDSPNYRVRRGLAHLLKTAFCTFETISPLEPQQLRQRVFALAALHLPNPQTSEHTLIQLADNLSRELEREVVPAEIRVGLYADLKENQILTQFEAPTPEALIHRYNLSQVQGVFYQASQIVLHVHRNDPGEYKLLFRYLKLYQLMAYVEGDADHGFTIAIDGAASLFTASTRYGLKLAMMLPALLHVTNWQLEATLQQRDTFTSEVRQRHFQLSHDCGLVSHYPPGKPYDSMIERSFADRWAAVKTDWHLEREVELLPIPGSVMIPDFRLVHPDGRTWLLEIVGYWRPEYLQKKFAQVRKSNCTNLILAISERLNLEKAGVDVREVMVPIVWFKQELLPKMVLTILEP